MQNTQFTAIDAVHGAMFVVTGVMGILAAFQVSCFLAYVCVHA